ncbi:MAG: DUF4148 domain-containing protein [Rhizobacter sp.]
MKKSLLIAATSVACLSTLCATLARADEPSRPLTREEVVAQTLAARQSGELAVLNAGGSWSGAPAAAPLTREQVVAATLAARQSGELAVLNAGGSWTAKTADAPMTRDEVIHQFMLSHQSSDALAMEHSL